MKEKVRHTLKQVSRNKTGNERDDFVHAKRRYINRKFLPDHLNKFFF
ncbi:MAG: hypothetical protein ACJAU0_001803 [Flavobacteriales bacterium]